MKTRHWLVVASAAALLGGVFPMAAAEPQDPEAMRHEARQLMEEAEKLMAAAEDRQRAWHERREHPDAEEPEELEFRIHHLHVAAEHLDEAGFHDAADAIRGEAEAMEREFHERRRHDPDDELAGAVRELGHAYRQLRSNVDELHEEVAQLRRRVDELSDRR